MIKMQKEQLIKVIAVTVILSVIGTLAVIFLTLRLGNTRLVNSERYSQMKEISERYEKLYVLQERMNQTSYKKLTVDQEMDYVYKGLVESLGDKYSEYFTPEEAKEWENYTNSTFYGIGIYFAVDDNNNFVIHEVMRDSPAEKVGLKKNDIIVSVDGKKYKTSEEVKDALTGEENTRVEVTYRRGKKEDTVGITRAEVSKDTVGSVFLDDDIAYIRISSFAQKTSEEFRTELASVEKKDPKGMIIDIRQNSGGYTDQGIKIADMLLPECTVTYLEDRNGNKKYYNSKEGCTKVKYVLLIDENTASTSELLAAAVKDNKGGELVGVTTFGKGVVQTESKFKDGSAMKITTNEYFSPAGHQINQKGVKPDHKVKYKATKDSDSQIDKAIEILENQ